MNDELKAAQRDVNLLKSLSNWLETRSKTAWAKESSNSALMCEYAAGLRGVLAACFQEDDEPVTEEWLESVSRKIVDKRGGHFFEIPIDDLPFNAERRIQISAGTLGTGYFVTLVEDTGMGAATCIALVFAKTRGAVRRVCRALGAELGAAV